MSICFDYIARQLQLYFCGKHQPRAYYNDAIAVECQQKESS
jgi:hypothetical protein